MPLTTTSGASQKINTYDGLDRVTSSAIKHNGSTIISDEWYYDVNGNNTSRLPNAYVVYLNGSTFTDIYTYDKNGNITFVEGNQGFIFYTYDSANQLIREDNESTGKTKTWTYDAAGNILTRSEYPYTNPNDELGTPTKTVNYYYEEPAFRDYLSIYDNTSIVYRDALGNPTRAYDYDTNTQWTYTWKHGRQLATLSDGTTTWSYTYNADGLRTKRTNGTTTYNYVYNGSQLTQMTVGTDTLYISYDASGRPFTLNYNGVVYYYVLNMLGDIVGITNSAGTVVVRYFYDAWGYAEGCTGALANTLGALNPLRYRGYVYDQETSLYYLQSRYYNPERGRFISADGQISGVGGEVLGYNQFAYCFNNPVNMTDSTGNWPKWLENTFKAVSVVVAVAAVVVVVATVAVVTKGALVGTAASSAVLGSTAALSASLSGINGGIANEAKGNSYINGYVGGATGAAIQSACSKSPVGTIIGGGVGVTLGTAVTDVMNNLDPDSSNSTTQEIVTNAATSGAKALLTSSITAFMGYSVDFAVSDGAGGLMPTFTFGFGEAFKTFWSWVDDALVYIWE